MSWRLRRELGDGRRGDVSVSGAAAVMEPSAEIVSSAIGSIGEQAESVERRLDGRWVGVLVDAILSEEARSASHDARARSSSGGEQRSMARRSNMKDPTLMAVMLEMVMRREGRQEKWESDG